MNPDRTWIFLFYLVIGLWFLMVYYTLVPWVLSNPIEMSNWLDLSFLTWILIGLSLVGSSLWFTIHVLYPFVRGKIINEQLQSAENGWYDYNGKPLVSIIIPARNEGGIIQRTIRGCLSQSYTNIEVLVICHNCSDNTFHQAQAIHDKRLRTFDLKTPEVGKGIALSYAVMQSRGDYLLIVDSDGILSHDFIDLALPLFGSRYAAVQGKIVGSNRNYSLVSRLLALESDLFSVPFMTVRHFLDNRTPLGGTGLLIRKDILHAVGGFRNELIDDFELSFRLFRHKYRIAFAPLSVVYDEKPPSVKLMIMQRSRWIRGHMDLLKERIPETSDIIGTIYWLQPIFLLGNISLIGLISYSVICYILFGSLPYTLSFFPIHIWLAMILTSYLLQMICLIQDHGLRALRDAGYVALLIPFSHYWYATLARAFFVKSWANTKTTHGYYVKPTSEEVKSANG
jgi:cellulose synthase/poly-beta-1,6-N-acetylglucosamine synthase-like glycosyltransferase